jgi:hypothetical protein
VNALPSPEHNKEAVLAAIHSSAGTLCTRVGYWRRRPPGYLAVFSTFARLRPSRASLAADSRSHGTNDGAPLPVLPPEGNQGGQQRAQEPSHADGQDQARWRPRRGRGHRRIGGWRRLGHREGRRGCVGERDHPLSIHPATDRDLQRGGAEPRHDEHHAAHQGVFQGYCSPLTLPPGTCATPTATSVSGMLLPVSYSSCPSPAQHWPALPRPTPAA